MKKITFLIAFALISTFGFSQTFTGTGGDIQTAGGTAATCGTTNELNLTVNVAGVGILGTANLLDQLNLDITHTWAGDIEVTLIAPDGTTSIDVTSDNGGSGDNYTNTVFSDDASGSITGGSAPFTGIFMPEEPLATFNTVNADGTWTLSVCDDASGDVGSVNSWSITFAPVPTCPNPNMVAATNVTDTTADFTWTAGGSEMAWEYVLQLASDPAPTSGVATSMTSFDATGLMPTTDFIFYVRANCGSEFSDFAQIAFTTLATPPSNDACAGAITINDGDSISGDTTGATNVEQLAPCMGGDVGLACDPGGDATPNAGTLVFGTGVWYVYNSPGGESISVEDSAGAFDSEIQVFSGSCGALACVAGDDDSSTTGSGGFVCFDAPTAETYYIYIDGNASTGTGAYTLNLNTTPFPDCLPPSNLQVTVQMGDTTAALNWDADATAVSGYNWAIMASGEDPTVDVPVTMGNTAAGVTNDTATGLTAGVDYDFYVQSNCDTDGLSSFAGPFSFTALAPSANDLCSSATVITVGLGEAGTAVTGTNGANTDSGVADPSCTTFYEGGDHWYQFTTPDFATAVTYTITVNTGISSSLVTIYDNCTDLNEIACTTVFGLGSDSLEGLIPSTTYVLRLADFGNDSEGVFEFNLSAFLPNDDCDGANQATLGAEVSGSNVGATDSLVTGDCFTGSIRDVWYSVDLTTETALYVNGLSTGFQYAIYSDCAGTLAATSCNAPATGLVAGTYYIRINDDGTDVTRASGAFVFTPSSMALSTNDFDSEFGFTYYPNPVKNTLTLNAQQNIDTVTMYNMLGQEVLRLSPNSINTEIDMSNLSNGAYFAKVSILGNTQTVRIIKQ